MSHNSKINIYENLLLDFDFTIDKFLLVRSTPQNSKPYIQNQRVGRRYTPKGGYNLVINFLNQINNDMHYGNITITIEAMLKLREFEQDPYLTNPRKIGVKPDFESCSRKSNLTKRLTFDWSGINSLRWTYSRKKPTF